MKVTRKDKKILEDSGFLFKEPKRSFIWYYLGFLFLAAVVSWVLYFKGIHLYLGFTNFLVVVVILRLIFDCIHYPKLENVLRNILRNNSIEEIEDVKGE